MTLALKLEFLQLSGDRNRPRSAYSAASGPFRPSPDTRQEGSPLECEVLQQRADKRSKAELSEVQLQGIAVGSAIRN